MNKFSHLKIESIRKEASNLIDEGFFEEAIPKLNYCLEFGNDPSVRRTVLRQLGYCFLLMGWYDDAARVFTQCLKSSPFDNDARFFLASAYASLGWVDEAIGESKKILASDPNDVLSYHALGLCYRDKGWLKESLDLMKIAKKHALVYGTQREIEIIEQSLSNIEKEIGDEGTEKLREALLLVILLTILKTRRIP